MGRGKEGGSRCFGLGGVPVSPLGEEGGGGVSERGSRRNVVFYYAEIVVIDGD